MAGIQMELEKWEAKQKAKQLSGLLLHFELMLSYQDYNAENLDTAFGKVMEAYEGLDFKFKS